MIKYVLLYPDQLLIRSKRLQGLPLLLKKTSALFIKRFHHTRRDVRGFIAQVVLPVLFVMAAMGLGTLRTKETEYPELILSPSLYGTSDQADFFGWVVFLFNLQPIKAQFLLSGLFLSKYSGKVLYRQHSDKIQFLGLGVSPGEMAWLTTALRNL